MSGRVERPVVLYQHTVKRESKAELNRMTFVELCGDIRG